MHTAGISLQQHWRQPPPSPHLLASRYLMPVYAPCLTCHSWWLYMQASSSSTRCRLYSEVACRAAARACAAVSRTGTTTCMHTASTDTALSTQQDVLWLSKRAIKLTRYVLLEGHLEVFV